MQDRKQIKPIGRKLLGQSTRLRFFERLEQNRKLPVVTKELIEGGDF